jgi:hypothetical protein
MVEKATVNKNVFISYVFYLAIGWWRMSQLLPGSSDRQHRLQLQYNISEVDLRELWTNYKKLRNNSWRSGPRNAVSLTQIRRSNGRSVVRHLSWSKACFA